MAHPWWYPEIRGEDAEHRPAAPQPPSPALLRPRSIAPAGCGEIWALFKVRLWYLITNLKNIWLGLTFEVFGLSPRTPAREKSKLNQRVQVQTSPAPAAGRSPAPPGTPGVLGQPFCRETAAKKGLESIFGRQLMACLSSCKKKKNKPQANNLIPCVSS